MPDELFVSNECYHSKLAKSMLANAPTIMRQNVRVTTIDHKNVPPNVTHVPTLIKQDGKMLVGAQVFDYLKKGRKDPHFPHTDVDEFFGSFGTFSTRNLIIGAVALVVVYYLYRKYSS